MTKTTKAFRKSTVTSQANRVLVNELELKESNKT